MYNGLIIENNLSKAKNMHDDNIADFFASLHELCVNHNVSIRGFHDNCGLSGSSEMVSFEFEGESIEMNYFGKDEIVV